MILRILKSKTKKENKNKKIVGVVILVLLLGFFIFYNKAKAGSDKIVINEIMYNPESGDSDWVEIFNSGDKDINLKEWNLIDEYELEKNKKGDKYLNCHTITKDDFIIKPKEYVVINKNDKYDLELKYLSLKSSEKDAVRISDDNCGSFADEVEYNPKKDEEVDRGYSLELDNGKWRESYIKGGTPKDENSKKTKSVNYEKDIRINELFPDPQESPEKKYEFIELYNFSDTDINLDDWKLEDESGSSFKLEGEIKKDDWLVFYKTVSLNNSGDEVIFRDPSGEEVDRVEYKKAQENFSYSYDSKKSKWKWSTFLTPGEKNKFDEDVKYSSEIRINEILPNPDGNEKKEEFIELFNYGKNDVNLKNWILKDNSKTGKYVFSKDVIIKSGGFLKIYRDDFKFALNNSNEEVVYLLNPKSEEVFKTMYDGANKNVSYNYDDKSKKWRWSRFLTPGEVNKFDKISEIKIKIDKKIYKNIYADFMVEVKNINKNILKIKWDFGDDYKSYKKETRHKYKKEGRYEVVVSVFNGSEDFEFKKTIKVSKFPRRDVEIISFVPNPKGKDTNGEWIEIKNNSKNKINLKGWSIATGKGKKSLVNHPINKKFAIKKGEMEKITREYSYFSLNNKEGYIEIRYPDGKVVDSIDYKKEEEIKDDEIYQKNKNGEWIWIGVNEKKIVESEQEELNSEQGSVGEVLGVESVVDEFVGKGSFVKLDRGVVFSKNLKIKKEILSFFWKNDLKPRLENDTYYFNPAVKKEKHYLFKVFESVLRS